MSRSWLVASLVCVGLAAPLHAQQSSRDVAPPTPRAETSSALRDIDLKRHTTADGAPGNGIGALAQDSPGFSGLTPILRAQPQRLRFEHLGIEQGLVAQTVVEIMQDRQGFLWIAAEGGLHRYDGHTIEAYTSIPFDTTSISDNIVYGIAEAENGDLWVNTFNFGLNRLDRATGRFTHYRHDPDDAATLSSDRTYGTLVDRRGDLWVTTLFGGLNRMRAGEDGRFTHYRHDPDDASSLSHDRLYGLSEDAEGHIWAGSANGINRIDPETETITRFLYNPEGTRKYYTAPHNVSDAYAPPEEPGVLWATTGNGLVRLNTRTGAHERFLIEPERDGRHDPLNRIRRVVPDPSDPDVLWVAGPGTGVARFDRRTGEFTSFRNDPRDPHSLSDNYALSLLADRSGTLWVGTRAEGVSRFNPGAVNFSHLQHDPDDAQSLAPGFVRGIHEDRSGTLWVGTEVTATEHYLTQFDAATGRATRHRHDPNDPATLQDGRINDFAEDSAGQLWVGTVGGLSRLDPATGRVTRYLHDGSTPEGQLYNPIWEVLAGRSDGSVLWVGSDGGLDRFDTRTGHLTPVLREDGETATSVGSLHEDAGGIVWAGAREGLLRIDPSEGATPRARLVSAYDARDPFSISLGHIEGITERAREPGILWLATAGGGLDRFDTKSGTARHYTTDDGLPSNVVYGAIEDGAGTLWMSTNGGISNFDPETETFRNYGLDDGLIALEFNGGSYARGAGGELYFGSGRGVTVFMPERLHTNAVPPQVALTGLRLFNKAVMPGPNSPLKVALSETEEIRLAHDQNEVRFDFVALHFANPAENRYAYRLEGFDRDWIDSGTDRTATYTNLPPGRYTFRVKAANSDGVWNEEGAAVKLTVLPPWWRTWWAYLGYGLLFLVGVARVDRVQRRRVVQKEREAARERELEQKREIERAYEQLKSAQWQLLQQAHRLEEMAELKSRFFANVSHEFRTPLTLLLGPIRDLIEGRIDAQRLASQAPAMHASAWRLHRLINQLLDLSRLESGAMRLHVQRGDLAASVRRHTLAFTPLAERDGVALAFESEPEAIGMAFDEDKVEKVVSNLLSNAFKFTPAGGRVRVAVRRDGAHVEITVRDTGEGIPAEELPLVFDRFHQVDSDSARWDEGTGIGLSLAKELVELLGGTVGVESERGFGSTFTVRLPLIPTRSTDDGAGATPTLAEGGAADSWGDGPHGPVPLIGQARGADAGPQDGVEAPADAPYVLLVDDNPNMRAYLRGHLAGTYRVGEAVDGADGLRQAREHPPDLVVSDVMMPVMDGFALCTALKSDEALGHVPVVLLTAKADEVSRIEGLEGGADDYLTKPFSVEELMTRVENLVEIRRRLRERYCDRVRLGPEEIVVSSADAAYVERVRDAVEAEMANTEFGVSQMAAMLGASERQLHRRVKETTGLTPAAYIRLMRLERADQLLGQRAGRVSDVAYAVGFNSPKYFSRLYRQTFGHPPSDVDDGLK